MTRNYVFKRFETDLEFRKRLTSDEDWPKVPMHAQAAIITATGATLDDYAWGHLRVQRRIIDDWA